MQPGETMRIRRLPTRQRRRTLIILSGHQDAASKRVVKNKTRPARMKTGGIQANPRYAAKVRYQKAAEAVARIAREMAEGKTDGGFHE